MGRNPTPWPFMTSQARKTELKTVAEKISIDSPADVPDSKFMT